MFHWLGPVDHWESHHCSCTWCPELCYHIGRRRGQQEEDKNKKENIRDQQVSNTLETSNCAMQELSGSRGTSSPLWLLLWPWPIQWQCWSPHPPHTRLHPLPFLPYLWCSPRHLSLTALLWTYRPCITSSTRGVAQNQCTRRTMGMTHLPPPGIMPREIGMYWIWWNVLLCLWALWLSALCLLLT